MLRLTLGCLVLVAGLIVAESASAQMILPTQKPMGNAMQRPRRKLHKNNSPVLSPALNMVPGVSSSFEGQFLMRSVPQEQANKNAAQVGSAIESLQGQVSQQQSQIRSGLGRTGHSARFMNYGSYYQMGGARRR